MNRVLVSFVFISFAIVSLGVAQVPDIVDSIVRNSRADTLLCNKLIKLSKSSFAKGSYDIAIKAAEATLPIYNSIKYHQGVCDAYECIAAVYVKKNDSANAFKYTGFLRDYSSKYNTKSYQYVAEFYEGKFYYQAGSYQYADSITRLAIKGSTGDKNNRIVSRSYLQLANIFIKKTDYKNAGENYLKALKIAEAEKDSAPISSCYTNLGTINRHLSNCNDAVYYHLKALSIASAQNNVSGIGPAYASLGDSYECKGNLDSAIISYKNAIPFLKQMNSINQLSVVYAGIGYAFKKQMQNDSALFYLKLAVTASANTHDKASLASALWNYGDVLMEKYKISGKRELLNEAHLNFKEVEQLAEVNNLRMYKLYVYKSLSQVLEKSNPAEALRYLVKYTEMNDSIISTNMTTQVAEMQTKFETEKKENEIAKLNTEKLLDAEKLSRQKTFNYSLAIIAALLLASGAVVVYNIQKKRAAEKQVAVLERQNAIESMRSKIASDVHDDMGANLTRLGLNAQQLLSAASSEKEKQLAEKISSQSKEVITGMREIIWASNPANDNLKSMLGFMRQYIDRFFDGTNIRPVVNFPHNVGEVALHPEVRRNLFLILKESLNNAIKYSGTDKIDIDFSNENENFNFNIKDYGKGIDDKNKDDFSNGLRNMQMRAEQIRSVFNLITEPGKGVQIRVEGTLY